MFFCVTGYLHPPDRYTAYLKYSPTSEGKWEDDSTAYRRELPYYHVRNVARTIDYLEEHYPAYVSYCPVRDFRFSMVPRDRVARYYLPEERLPEILDSPQDQLEEEVRGLALQIAAEATLEPAVLGITGSVLIGLHNPAFSDIDLTIYGLDNARRLRKALREDNVPSVHRLGNQFTARWSKGIAERFPLTVEEARYFASRRWNYGSYRGRYFSIHPIRSDEEINEVYGDHVYRGCGTGRIRATVADAGEALFMPAIYQIEDVRLLEGDPAATGVRELVSYEGLYRDVVDAGSLVEAKGKVETVDGEPRRLVIGSLTLGGQGYVKPVRGI
jgi:hypothetical protein